MISIILIIIVLIMIIIITIIIIFRIKLDTQKLLNPALIPV